jgi:hypothetical protein
MDRMVLRGFVVLPLFAQGLQGQHYVFYLLYVHHRGGGGSD